MKNLTKPAFWVVALLMLCQCTPPPSNEPTYNITEGHTKVWNAAIDQVVALSDAMPEDQYNYKPHDSVRTFAEQLIHIGGSSMVIANLYLKDIPPPQDQPDLDVANMSKGEIVDFVRARLEDTREIMIGMSDQQLMDTIQSFGGNTMTRLEGLLTVHDHLTNHKAKANLYVRITGNTPPRYSYY